jgi:hypothetical protein
MVTTGSMPKKVMPTKKGKGKDKEPKKGGKC